MTPRGQYRAPPECPACGRLFAIGEIGPGRRFPCPRCGVALEVAPAYDRINFAISASFAVLVPVLAGARGALLAVLIVVVFVAAMVPTTAILSNTSLFRLRLAPPEPPPPDTRIFRI